MRTFSHKLKIGEEGRKRNKRCEDEVEFPAMPCDRVDHNIPPDIRRTDVPQAAPCGVYRQLDLQTRPGSQQPQQAMEHAPIQGLKGILRDPASARPKRPLSKTSFCPKTLTISIPEEKCADGDDSGKPLSELYIFEPRDPCYCVEEGELPPWPQSPDLSCKRLANIDHDENDTELPGTEKQMSMKRWKSGESLGDVHCDDTELPEDEQQCHRYTQRIQALCSKSATDLMELTTLNDVGAECPGGDPSLLLGRVGRPGVGAPSRVGPSPDRDVEDACQGLASSRPPNELQRELRKLERIIKEWDTWVKRAAGNTSCTSTEHDKDEA